MTAGLSSLPKQLGRIEYPTLLLCIAIYGGLLLLTYFHRLVPLPLLILLGGYFVAWQGSLQHEVVHGHPTPWRWVNRLLVLPSPWLVVPFGLYRESHLRHHRDELLTDPLEDPESYYLTDRSWRRAGPLGRGLLRANNSLLGRLLLGPLLLTLRSAWDFATALRRLDGEALTAWAAHGLGVALVLFWAMGVCGLSFWEYALYFVYPGLSLTLLRSFAEHRATTVVSERTATLEAEWPLGLLFLNNNLHSVHHAQPGLPWYRIPAAWRATRPDEAEGAGERFKGYRELVRRYLLTAKEHPLHPSERRQQGAVGAGLRQPGGDL
jgi:fatty acid desaturase